MRIRPDAGFTLIEILVVVIILAALAGMVLPHVLPAGNTARQGIARADIANIRMALKMYRLHTGKYPSGSDGLDILTRPSPSYNNEPYLENDPVDPWKNPYKYSYPGSHGGLGFDISSAGPDGQFGNEDDINSWDKE